MRVLTGSQRIFLVLLALCFARSAVSQSKPGATVKTATVVVAAVDANGNPIPLNRRQPQRILGVMPNFRSVSGGASVNATLQAGIAAHYGGDYAIALAVVAGTVAVAIAILTALGPEARAVKFGGGPIAGSAAVSPAL